MANSSVWFYRVGWDVTENAYVDDLEDYLTGLSNWYDILDFQYIRHSMNVSIKVNVSQTQADNFQYNYCKVYNSSDGYNVYYYIKNVKQVSPQTLTIDLVMDTVNTIGQNGFSPYDFTNKTEIVRQHGDRFKEQSIDRSTSVTLTRNIDKATEGIVPEKKNFSKVQLLEESAPGTGLTDWYLIYRSRPEAVNGIDTLLCASKEITVSITGGEGTRVVTPSDLQDGIYYYVDAAENAEASFRYNQLTTAWTATIGGYYQIRDGYNTDYYDLTGFVFWKDGNKIKARFDGPAATGTHSNAALYSINAGSGGWTFYEYGVDSITVTNLTVTRNSTESDIPVKYAHQLISTIMSWEIGPVTRHRLTPIDNFIRTDPQLIKIIKYPYCPVPHTLSGTVMTFDEKWKFDGGFMKYTEDNIPQLGVEDCVDITFPELQQQFTAGSISYTSMKRNDTESKLYHSDFYTDKLVYDSFSKDIKLENLNRDGSTNTAGIDFKPTSTINSKFGFKINYGDVGTYTAEEDFDDVLLVTRNNEETILNNEYINYIKYGYEYDKKQNALQIQSTQRNAGFSTAGSVIGAAASLAGVIFGGPTVKAASVIGLGTSIAGGVMNTANAWTNVSETQAKQDNAMQAKLAQLAAQSTSTSGTDDVDLMSWYSNNKLWHMKYRPSDLIRGRLDNLFHLTGYAHDTIEKPNVESRIWFNYLQCTPQFVNTNSGKFKAEWIDDMKQRYQQGVVVYHKNQIDGVDTYDFNKQYENWEAWMFNE